MAALTVWTPIHGLWSAVRRRKDLNNTWMWVWTYVHDKSLWEAHIVMPSETRFEVTCGNEKHLVIITTEYIPEPDNPTSGKKIPAPHLEYPNHCQCPDTEHCTRQCEGQKWLEGQLALLKMTEGSEMSCAQWHLEFCGEAPKRIEQAWWRLLTPETTKKVAAKK